MLGRELLGSPGDDMKVRVAGSYTAIEILPDDVESDVRWLSDNLCEGHLLDGRPFRCRASAEDWQHFMTRTSSSSTNTAKC